MLNPYQSLKNGKVIGPSNIAVDKWGGKKVVTTALDEPFWISGFRQNMQICNTCRCLVFDKLCVILEPQY